MSTSRIKAKKERERRHIKAFLELSEISAEIVDDGESPDFVLSINERKVGVELTEIYISNDENKIPLKAKESLAAKIVQEARHRYEAAKGIPLRVAIGFSPRTDFKSLNRTDTARVLADFLLGQSIRSELVQSWRSTLNGPLPLEINFLNAVAVPNQEAAHWYAPQAGWVVALTEERLQASIDAKTCKLRAYQRTTPETWLVLVVAGGAPSQLFDIRHCIDQKTIHSPFNRTFLLSLIDGTVQELGNST